MHTIRLAAASLCVSIALAVPVPAQEDPLAAANSLIAAEKWAKARSALEAIVAGDEANGQAWFALGRCHQQLGETEAAIAAYERAAETGAPPPRSLYYAARVASAAGQGDRAVGLLRRVVEAGGAPYLATRNAPEFEIIRQDPRFQEILERMKPCNSEEYRQFDFWLGTWDVTVGGQLLAVNRITQDYGTCLVREAYETLNGFAGTSLNFYDATSGHWHQTWIDNSGQALRMTGGLVDGKMVLTTEPGDSMTRYTWTPNADGTVRQLAESTTDGGKSWTAGFDGLYSLRADGE